MLSVSRIRSASRAGDYYGKDDYYVTGEADAPGLTWGGRAAEALGLSGAARPADFKAVLGGSNPDPKGPAISGGEAGAKHHPGWDLTFSAPKSVSVAILLGGDRQLDAAHDRAVQQAMDYAERHLSFTRVRDAGQRKELLTGNLLYATTVHGTSREGDPQRHTHVVVANATFDRKAGAWRALESLHLYRHRKLLGKIYQAELAKEAMALGHDVRRERRDGTYGLAAWSREQLRVFAKRAEAIRRTLEIEKPRSAAAKDTVKLKNRPTKIDRPRQALVERWKAEAAIAGIDVDLVIAAASARGQGEDRTPQTWGRVSEVGSKVRAAFAHLTATDRAGRDPYRYLKNQQARDPAAREAVSHALQVAEVGSAVFSRHQVIEGALDAARAGVGIDRIETDLSRLEKDGRVVAAAKAITGGITTSTSLAVERAIVSRIDDGRAKTPQLLSRADVLSRLSHQPSGTGPILNAGQRGAVATILSSVDRYTAVQGYAGVGKTTMLAAARRLGEGAGLQFSAIAPTHRAAVALDSEAGIHATTVAAWLVSTGRAMKTRSGLANLRAHWKDRALVVDESSMVANEQMQSILTTAERIGITRVIMVGDDRQLGSPQAGAPFRLLLTQRIAQAKVTEIVRQRDPTLRESVRQLARGRPGEGLRLVTSRIHSVGAGADDKALAKAAVAAARQMRRVGGEPRIIVPTNALRGLVSENVRAERMASGALSQEGVMRERYYHARLDGPDRFRAGAYEIGQRLVFHAALRGPGIRRGLEADIIGLDLRNDVLKVQTPGGVRSVDLRALAAEGRKVFDAYRVKMSEVALGERMVWERADPRRGFLTGSAFTVVSMSERFWTIRHDGGRAEQIRADDPALKFTGYAYAETADRAQGQTYQSVVAVLASHHGEAASVARQYVMQSRPSETLQLITDETRLLLLKLARQDGLNLVALENIRTSLATEGPPDRSMPISFADRENTREPEPAKFAGPETKSI